MHTLEWRNGPPLSVSEWSRLDLGTMLYQRPAIIHPEYDLCDLLRMPRLIFVDGASISIQAGNYVGSSPCDAKGPYTKVEAGFPSEPPPETWREFAEDWDRPTGTVYRFIPLVMVLMYIGAHGGIDRKATFKNYQFKLRHER